MSARCQVAQALIEADKRPEQIATGFDLFKAERLDVNEPEARADGLEPAAQGLWVRASITFSRAEAILVEVPESRVKIAFPYRDTCQQRFAGIAV